MLPKCADASCVHALEGTGGTELELQGGLTALLLCTLGKISGVVPSTYMSGAWCISFPFQIDWGAIGNTAAHLAASATMHIPGSSKAQNTTWLLIGPLQMEDCCHAATVIRTIHSTATNDFLLQHVPSELH